VREFIITTSDGSAPTIFEIDSLTIESIVNHGYGSTNQNIYKSEKL
jgi:hypothetical protein